MRESSLLQLRIAGRLVGRHQIVEHMLLVKFGFAQNPRDWIGVQVIGDIRQPTAISSAENTDTPILLLSLTATDA
ncbi:hypothetical protein BSLG_006079 [Batrachochytrium salamandrivorans]|nr:hypothetical protein BSLG_006079 [Batrachochytrium salamandrivorans]